MSFLTKPGLVTSVMCMQENLPHWGQEHFQQHICASAGKPGPGLTKQQAELSPQCDQHAHISHEGQSKCRTCAGRSPSVTGTNRFCPLRGAVTAAAQTHVVDAGLSWEPRRPLALHVRESSSARLQDLFQRDYTTFREPQNH